ncbi:hypothetical protein HPB50_025206 [Hyalomma asiaticum]|uniref:Uncharacterized protein n=1 Tax=Hyalomma asiaticum TaxID=266040 RepID=A0ACB7S663_HYAAI|nr:hypothetical protein HPB50_025206 [Hyalomma asiaticum]
MFDGVYKAHRRTPVRVPSAPVKKSTCYSSTAEDMDGFLAKYILTGVALAIAEDMEGFLAKYLLTGVALAIVVLNAALCAADDIPPELATAIARLFGRNEENSKE